MRAGSCSPAWSVPALCGCSLMVRRARGAEGAGQGLPPPGPPPASRRPRPPYPGCFSPMAPGKRPRPGENLHPAGAGSGGAFGGHGNRELPASPSRVLRIFREEPAIPNSELPVPLAALFQVIVGKWWGTVRQQPRESHVGQRQPLECGGCCE